MALCKARWRCNLAIFCQTPHFQGGGQWLKEILDQLTRHNMVLITLQTYDTSFLDMPSVFTLFNCTGLFLVCKLYICFDQCRAFKLGHEI